MEQINLNRPELWPRPTPFAARTMAVLLAVLVAALVGLYVYQSYRVDRQRQALQAAEDQRDRVQKELQAAEEAHRQRREQLEALRADVADLKERIAAFREAEQALRTRLEAAGSKGELVRALGRARAQQDGVWLTRFRLAGVNPVRLRLEGRADPPEAIPRYLQAVVAQKPYSGGSFRDLKANAPEDGPGGGEVLTFHSEAAFPVVQENGQ
ncbi:hypothetical protein [Thiohalorhabdus sp.]|uniref:hypothetical protein n=1 Tax=Thiohalorhabdus sp. TaxID=3094134 RepID=UPI002FC36B88